MEVEKVIKNLKSRNISGYFVKSKQEAKNKVIELIDQKEIISVGGSITLDEIQLLDELRNGDYNFIDRAQIKDNVSMKHWVMKNAATHGTFITGTNALTEDGQIYNVDGWGNRVNGIQYGPDKVIIVMGRNKIVKNLEEADKRVKEIAAPKNTVRLNKKTPCVKTGKCMDCRSPDRICNIISVVQFQNNPDRIHVIIVDEDLGY